MPIDEAVLNETIAELKTVIDNAQGDLNNYSKVLFSLMSIQKPEGKNVPDYQTGEMMTDERRQEIYDANKTKADDIIP